MYIYIYVYIYIIYYIFRYLGKCWQLQIGISVKIIMFILKCNFYEPFLLHFQKVVQHEIYINTYMICMRHIYLYVFIYYTYIQYVYYIYIHI